MRNRMNSDENRSEPTSAGSSARIEHRPSKPVWKSAVLRGGSSAPRDRPAPTQPQKPKHHSVLLRGLPIEQRFAALLGPLRPDGCRYWLGRLDRDGYGRIQSGEKEYGAHRFALELKLGRPLRPDEATRHLCAVRLCVAAEHLVPGTWDENAKDAAAAGRTFRPPVRLTDAQVEEIRRRRAAGEPGTKLGLEYGVSSRLIYYVERGEKRAKPTPVPEGYFVKALRCPGGFRATARGKGFEESAEAPRRGEAIRLVLAKVESLLTALEGES